MFYNLISPQGFLSGVQGVSLRGSWPHPKGTILLSFQILCTLHHPGCHLGHILFLWGRRKYFFPVRVQGHKRQLPCFSSGWWLYVVQMLFKDIILGRWLAFCVNLRVRSIASVQGLVSGAPNANAQAQVTQVLSLDNRLCLQGSCRIGLVSVLFFFLVSSISFLADAAVLWECLLCFTQQKFLSIYGQSGFKFSSQPK